MKWLKNNSRKIPDKLFINNLTYEDVYKRVCVLVQKLAGIIGQETRVGLYAGNSEETAIFILSLMVLKKEILLLNFRLTEEEVKQQCVQLGIKVVFSSTDKYISYEEVYKNRRSELNLTWEIDADQTSVIMNTSATTGEMKSVPLCWSQISSHVAASSKVLGVQEDDNWLAVLPLYHISGLSILLRSLYNGTRITILDSFREEDVLDLINEKRINMISLVPTILNRIIDRITEHHLRVILLGGEFIPVPLIKQCLQKSLPVYKTYGMTETTSQSTTFCILEYPDKLDSVGSPLPGVELLVKNADEEGIGEICLRSPMLMRGYIGQVPINGYFNTGDIGYISADGFLYILNRRCDMIISGGENIYPQEIENILYSLLEVKECAVVGKKDDRWGQLPVLYIVSDLREEDIQEYLGRKLAKYKVPKKIIYKKELPKTDSGKVIRKILREGEKYESDRG